MTLHIQVLLISWYKYLQMQNFCGSMTYCQYRVIEGIENEVIGIKEDVSLHTSTLFTVYN